MRRYLLGLGVFALVATGAFAVYAGIQRNKSCAPSGESTAVQAGDPSEPAAAPEPRRGAIAGNFDPAMSGVCRFACATKLKYKAADVVAQPGAVTGRLSQCPVSGVVFVVDGSRPRLRIDENEYVACCGNCATKLQHDPRHYLKA